MTKKIAKGGETSLGGPGKEFPRTTQGFLDGLGDAAALETLGRRYWKPVYCFLRAAWSKSNEEAKDLCQHFFLWLLESKVLERYRSDRASFRTFLKLQLRGFVSDQHKAAGRWKRGGDVRFVGLGEGGESLEQFLRDSKAVDPETVFDRAWFMSVLAEAIDRVRNATPPDRFRVFEAYDLSSQPEGPTYAGVARELGIAESRVRDILAALRREIREEVRAELRRQTRATEDFEKEWNEFLGL